MYAIVKSSLREMACGKIATVLWSDQDIQDKIRSIYSRYSTYLYYCNFTPEIKWDNVQMRVLEKADLLPLPTFSKNMLRAYIKHIGEVLLHWLLYSRRYTFHFSTATEFVKNIIWTSDGSIDEKETAKKVLGQPNNISPVDRYKLACICCLEEYVPILWEGLNKNDRETVCNIESILPFWRILIGYWNAQCMGKVDEWGEFIRVETPSGSMNIVLFRVCMELNNEIGTKYFWMKLTDEERKRAFFPMLQKVIESHESNYIRNNIAIFLLSEMHKIHPRPLHINFNCFLLLRSLLLDLRFENNYMQILEHLFKYISSDIFLKILVMIGEATLDENESLSAKYLCIFKELFLYPPEHLKEYMHEMLINLILKTDRKGISNDGARSLYSLFIFTQQFALLQSFIQNNISSKEEISCFKEKLAEKAFYEFCPDGIFHQYKVDLAMTFLRWCFTSESDIENFKRKFVFQEFGIQNESLDLKDIINKLEEREYGWIFD